MKKNQSELARRVGVDRSFVSQILSGKRKASYELALIISEIVGGDPGIWILGSRDQRIETFKKWEGSNEC